MPEVQEDTLLVAPGFRMPFFPMRPETWDRIRTEEDLRSAYDDTDYDWSLKLNGDRACLAIVDGTTYLQNRHGSRYKMTADNVDDFAGLKGAWLFDGEVFGKKFFPFEVIIAAGKPTHAECPSVRKDYAKQICKRLGLPWMYGSSVRDSFQIALNHLGTDGSIYEGLVGKRMGSPYVPLGSAGSTSSGWIKRKWV
jgi:hypothetical protein